MRFRVHFGGGARTGKPLEMEGTMVPRAEDHEVRDVLAERKNFLYSPLGLIDTE